MTINTLAERVGVAFADPFLRALIRRVLTIGPEGENIRRDYFDSAVAPRRAIFARAIVKAQDAGQIDPVLDPALVQDAIAGALTYKLFSGDADQPGFDAQQYALDMFSIVGLKR